MSISDRLDEIQARADAANDSPWKEDGQNFWTPSGRSDFHLAPADVKFIVEARTDVPRLVAALRAVLDLCDKALAVKVSGSTEGDAAMASFASAARSAITAALGEDS